MEQLPKNIKCVIFDLDGTLAGFENRVHAAYLAAFQEIGSKKVNTWTLKDTRAQNGRAPDAIFKDEEIWGRWEYVGICNTYSHFLGDEAKKAFYKAYNAQPETHPELCSSGLYEGAVEAITAAQKSGARVVLLGAKTESILKKEAEVLGIASYFDALQGATGDEKTDKPAAGAFDRAVEGLNITDKKQVVYVGDNPKKDPAFAKSWGATSVIVQPEQDKTALKSLAHAFETTYPVSRQTNLSGPRLDNTRTKV